MATQDHTVDGAEITPRARTLTRWKQGDPALRFYWTARGSRVARATATAPMVHELVFRAGVQTPEQLVQVRGDPRHPTVMRPPTPAPALTLASDHAGPLARIANAWSRSKFSEQRDPARILEDRTGLPAPAPGFPSSAPASGNGRPVGHRRSVIPASKVVFFALASSFASCPRFGATGLPAASAMIFGSSRQDPTQSRRTWAREVGPAKPGLIARGY